MRDSRNLEPLSLPRPLKKFIFSFVRCLCTHLGQFVQLVTRLVPVDVYEPALDVEHPVVVLVQEVTELAQQPLVVVGVASLQQLSNIISVVSTN